MIKKLIQGFRANKADSNTRRAVVANNNALIDTLFDYDATPIIGNLSDADIDKILDDLIVSQADESRKSVTEKKEVIIVTENEKYKDIFEKAFTPELISQILDTYMYGFNTFEVNWTLKDGLYVPSLLQRDYRCFQYKNDELKFMLDGQLIDIQEYKIITATYRKRFNKPYGNGTISKLYFPVKLKNASLKFWVRFLEKYGSPWTIGKTDDDADGLAEEINAMLSGDTAVIDPDEEIELIHPSGSKGDFDKLIDYCDTQINRVILGGNLTGDVKGGSHAAASVHNDIREDLANTDKKILEHVLNTATNYFKEINDIKDDLWVQIKDEDDPQTELATRDKTISEMGYRPKKEYIEKTYNIEVEDATENTNASFLNKAPFKQHLISLKAEDKDEEKARDQALEFEKLVESFTKNVNMSKSNFMDILDSSKSFDDVLKELDGLSTLDQETIYQAILISELYGIIKDA
jgi:phage gp29-like protein